MIKTINLGYFSLPEGAPDSFPRTSLLLDQNGKIINESSGDEITYYQFIRSLAIGDITLTKEGEEFVNEKIESGQM